MVLGKLNLACLMVEGMVNTMVMAVWRHLRYLQSTTFYFGDNVILRSLQARLTPSSRVSTCHKAIISNIPIHPGAFTDHSKLQNFRVIFRVHAASTASKYENNAKKFLSSAYVELRISCIISTLGTNSRVRYGHEQGKFLVFHMKCCRRDTAKASVLSRTRNFP